jgi:hypothetical protein
VHASSRENEYPELTRPVIGAFCLFPGWYPDEVQRSGKNPYDDAVSAVGVGAFPALPGQENVWLREFLTSQFGEAQSALHGTPGPSWQLAQWAPRTAPHGLRLRYEGGMVFVAHVGAKRKPEYLSDFASGKAAWFHVRNSALDRGSISPSAMRDVVRCAVAHPDPDGSGSYITHVYEVKSLSVENRSDISSGQSGTDEHTSTDKYWLFELGKSVTLPERIRYQPTGRFKAWITSDEFLKAGGEFPLPAPS